MAYEKVKQRKKRASRFDWQVLITRQLESGTPVAQFCREHQLSTSAFYHNRVKLFPELSPQSKSFISAQVIPSTAPMMSPVDDYFTLTYANTTLSLPHTTSPALIIELMQGVSS